MKKQENILFLMSVILILTGCAKRTPAPGVSVSRVDAQMAITTALNEIKEAKKAGADTKEAETAIENARKLFEKKNYAEAKNEADRAGQIARRLKQEMLANVRSKEDVKAAIERAQKFIDKAAVLGGDVSDPEKLLYQAKAELNYSRAIELADRAANMAQDIINSLQFERYTVGTWETDRDCLWNIAGKKGIYNDPWKWKRIYLANRDKIKDPDLIYPSQVLKIPRN
jgi:nucleoid-associated protein YgaU